MARGWESKAIEAQIEEKETRSSRRRPVQASAEEISLERERQAIQLSRTRVLQDLALATNPNYREYLARSLRFLDEKLSVLNKAANTPDRHA